MKRRFQFLSAPVYRLLLLWVIATTYLFGEQQWISLTTPHFEMYTTNDKEQAAQQVQFLDQVRSFFADSSPFRNNAGDILVQIIAFRSEAEYAPYAFREAGGAYSLRTFNHDYMILPDPPPRRRALVVHEFTHLVVQHAGFRLPIWLNEGLAEVYSSMDVTSKQIIVGRPPPPHMETLQRQQWIPWDTLFAVDANSPYYRDGGKISLFYAESWALVHMLSLSDDYSPRFRQFLSAVSEGKGTAQALQATYAKSISSIEQDLSSYVHRKSLPEALFDTKSTSREIQPKIGRPSDFQINFTLANLLLAKPSSLSEAQSKLAALIERYPEAPEPEEVLGALALQQNRKDKARSHLALAVQHHSRNTEIIFQYAALQEDAGVKDSEVASTLRRALEVKPDFEKARLELGLLEARDSHFESALSLLSNLKSIAPDDEFDVYSSIAHCQGYIDHNAEAAAYAEKAKRAARTAEQKKEAADLIANFTADPNSETTPIADDSPVKPSPSLSSVWGRTKFLECSKGGRRLRIDIAGRDMVFALDDPNLIVRNGTEKYSHWICGALQPANLTVVFTPGNGSNPVDVQNPDGNVRELVFADPADANDPPKRKKYARR